MSKHVAKIDWKRQTDGFAYDEFNREHLWQFGSGAVLKASAAPEYLGTGSCTDPEEAFVASVSSCHMLSFLAICARKRLPVNRYRDCAVGSLQKNAAGKLHLSRIELSPRIEFDGPAPDKALLVRLHELAHRECFIANSILTDITLTRYC